MELPAQERNTNDATHIIPWRARFGNHQGLCWSGRGHRGRWPVTVQHIALVLGADGLSASEKLLLIAYCNHTDAHGYCWPGIARLADETGMSVRTVHRTNSALRAKGLIKSVRRVNPRTGEPITNLTRINLALLASMQRPAGDYGDNLLEEITFDEHNPSDLLMCHSDTPQVSNWHGVGDRLAPKPSEETSEEPPPPPSSSSSAASGADGGQEEEEGIPQTDHHGAPGWPQRAHVVPVRGSRIRAATGDHAEKWRNRLSSESGFSGTRCDLRKQGTAPATATADHGEAAALVADLPTLAARAGRPLARALRADETNRLTALVTAALARGWTAEQIRAVLADDLRTARSPVATWHARLSNLGNPPAPAAPAAPPKCDECNPFRWIEDDEGRPLERCPTCHPALAVRRLAA